MIRSNGYKASSLSVSVANSLRPLYGLQFDLLRIATHSFNPLNAALCEFIEYEAYHDKTENKAEPKVS
ncbi:hypothetical protein TUM4438_35890 [Shewanella sairae]|uniref:Uncharacterized protein n=1 Tax=Shewanella sairae TaxID=190310 RepID=A0ABQ4PPD2_9GAMM|nr:hypothetical protein TUM4438_35890 [Shewanella sairae]